MNRPYVKIESRRFGRLGQRKIVCCRSGARHRQHHLLNRLPVAEVRKPRRPAGLPDRTLQSIWRDHLRAYHGVAFEALPHFDILYGPNTNLSHVSILLMYDM